MGWITVVSYALAGVLAYAAALKCSKKNHGHPKEKRLFTCVSLLMILLAINKQLDLQSLFTDIGRLVAKKQHWYEKRRTVQLVFVIFFTMFSSTLFYVAIKQMRSYFVNNRTLFAGIGFLLLFIVIRAASFHHFDRFLNLRPVSVRVNWLLELGGIGLVAAGTMKRILKSNNRNATLPIRR